MIVPMMSNTITLVRPSGTTGYLYGTRGNSQGRNITSEELEVELSDESSAALATSSTRLACRSSSADANCT